MSVKIFEQNEKDHLFTTFKRPDKSSGILECHSHSIVQVLNHFVIFADRLKKNKQSNAKLEIVKTWPQFKTNKFENQN